MAAEGIRFTDAHSPSTICSPSRYSLFSGQQIYRSTGRGGGAFEGPGGPSFLQARHRHARRHAPQTGIPHRRVRQVARRPDLARQGRASDSRGGFENSLLIDYEKSTPAGRWPERRAASTNRSSPRTARPPTRSTSTSKTGWSRCLRITQHNRDTLPNPGGKWRWDNDEGWVAPGYEFVKADLLFYDKMRSVHHHAPEEPPGPTVLRGALHPDRPRAGAAGPRVRRRHQGRPARRFRASTRCPRRTPHRPAQGKRDRRRNARPFPRRQRSRNACMSIGCARTTTMIPSAAGGA